MNIITSTFSEYSVFVSDGEILRVCKDSEGARVTKITNTVLYQVGEGQRNVFENGRDVIQRVISPMFLATIRWAVCTA